MPKKKASNARSNTAISSREPQNTARRAARNRAGCADAGDVDRAHRILHLGLADAKAEPLAQDPCEAKHVLRESVIRAARAPIPGRSRSRPARARLVAWRAARSARSVRVVRPASAQSSRTFRMQPIVCCKRPLVQRVAVRASRAPAPSPSSRPRPAPFRTAARARTP